MFDDPFLFAALERVTENKRLLALSVRQESDFALYKRFGWHTCIERDVMISKPLTSDDLSLEVILDGVENQNFSLFIGDLAAYTEARVGLIQKNQPAAVKFNFVTSPIDGQAFLPTNDSDKMLAAALELVETLRELGYACRASTWYRNDVPPRIWKLEGAADMTSFPFNVAAFKDQACADTFEFMAQVFSEQETLFSREHTALVERLNSEIADRDKKSKEEIATRNHYIRMLEDAMIALQPSEKIKLGG